MHTKVLCSDVARDYSMHACCQAKKPAKRTIGTKTALFWHNSFLVSNSSTFPTIPNGSTSGMTNQLLTTSLRSAMMEAIHWHESAMQRGERSEAHPAYMIQVAPNQ